MKLANALDIHPPVVRTEMYDEIREALRAALSETLSHLVSRDSIEALVAQVAARKYTAAPASRPSQPAGPGVAEILTTREIEILNHIASGSSNKAIARALGLSLHTVKRHVANILGKLGVSSRVQAATWLSARH